MALITRRSFLGTSAAGAAALTVPGWSHAKPNEVFRIAVVGVKGRGLSHVGEWAKMKDVQVAALVDIDENILDPALKIVERNGGK